MQDKVIITCAVTGSGATVGKHPAIPVTPEEIARAAIEAGEAGAAIAHIHVRDPKTGKPSRDPALFRDVVERVRASKSDIILNLSCGAGGRYDPHPDDPRQHGPASTMTQPAERMRHVTEMQPEICSLDVGTMNMGEFAFVNIPRHLREMARLMRERRNTKGASLSGGEQQMLTICRSLLGNPLLMLIDEPTEGLAPKIVAQVGECIQDMHRRGVSVVLVEQKLALALKVSTRVCLVGHGRIVFEGRPEQLQSDPALLAQWLAV